MQNAILSLLTQPSTAKGAGAELVSENTGGDGFALLVDMGETAPDPLANTTDSPLAYPFAELLLADDLAALGQDPLAAETGKSPTQFSPQDLLALMQEQPIEGLPAPGSIPVDVSADGGTDTALIAPDHTGHARMPMVAVPASEITQMSHMPMQDGPVTPQRTAAGMNLPETLPVPGLPVSTARSPKTADVSKTPATITGAQAQLPPDKTLAGGNAASIPPVKTDVSQQLPVQTLANDADGQKRVETPPIAVGQQGAANPQGRVANPGNIADMTPEVAGKKPVEVAKQETQTIEPTTLTAPPDQRAKATANVQSGPTPETPPSAQSPQIANPGLANNGNNAKTQISPIQMAEMPMPSNMPKPTRLTAPNTTPAPAAAPTSEPIAPPTSLEMPDFITLDKSGAIPAPLAPLGGELGALNGLQSPPIQGDGFSLATVTAKQEPALARHVAAQMAEIAQPLPNRPVDMTLNPEELGKVRLTFTAENGALAISVNAERPETLDLMRRHIETLAQELRSLGYRDVSFGFGQSGGNAGAGTSGEFSDAHSGPSGDDMPPPEQAAQSHPDQAPPIDPTAGIDIRL